ncbi:MAG: class I SAM-dependent methyltransferase [Xenococcaceae cyanobacterium]
MRHQEIYNVLHKFLVSYFQKPFKMLDLGCGDARFVAKSLVNTNINFYQGIDLAKSSLKIAGENMAFVPCTKILSQKDISTWISELEQSQRHCFDVVLASFVLHHLTIEQKDRIIGQIFQLLKTDGVFILIDLIRREGEDREAYIKRYLDGVRRNWKSLSDREISMIETHICQSNFPETLETLNSIAKKHGFFITECLDRYPLDTNRLLCFFV